jgi:hypothetical protein
VDVAPTVALAAGLTITAGEAVAAALPNATVEATSCFRNCPGGVSVRSCPTATPFGAFDEEALATIVVTARRRAISAPSETTVRNRRRFVLVIFFRSRDTFWVAPSS